MTIGFGPERIAQAIGGEIAGRGGPGEPSGAAIDSREVGPGDLFFGLRGERMDGGTRAGDALAAGAWGVVVGPEHAAGPEGGWVFSVPDPLAALGALARERRRDLGARVVGITGSVGKTSVKDITRSLLPGRVHSSPENFNTEIGLPLTVLAAPAGTEILVLEMAMRGPGQIAELAEIAEPDVGVITNIGPVHVELLGSVEAIAAVKAELLADLPEHGAAVVPVDEPLLDEHLGAAPRVIRFGVDGDVRAASVTRRGESTEALIVTPAGEHLFTFPFAERHNVTNALAAVGAGVALGFDPADLAPGAADIGFSRFRGERLTLGDRITLVNDCYNANPVSMRAALENLAESGGGRRIAVLGVMAELGPEEAAFHEEVGEHARALGIDAVVGVGEAARGYRPDDLVADPAEAAELLAGRLEPGDTVLVKGSRSARMERVAEALEPLLGGGGGG
jgi:UDP-N-acetylmuramoyl-tripeptide--D-alanyl-D-alanine ligase